MLMLKHFHSFSCVPHLFVFFFFPCSLFHLFFCFVFRVVRGGCTQWDMNIPALFLPPYPPPHRLWRSFHDVNWNLKLGSCVAFPDLTSASPTPAAPSPLTPAFTSAEVLCSPAHSPYDYDFVKFFFVPPSPQFSPTTTPPPPPPSKCSELLLIQLLRLICLVIIFIFFGGGDFRWFLSPSYWTDDDDNNNNNNIQILITVCYTTPSPPLPTHHIW